MVADGIPDLLEDLVNTKEHREQRLEEQGLWRHHGVANPPVPSSAFHSRIPHTASW